jgi:murein DD-endopeptidase MepM/ murein hydrolase activator NlpD
LPGDPVVLRAFRRPPRRWNAGHRGIDLRATQGATVLAPRAGTVTFAGTVVDRGVVTITHPDGLRSSLEPLAPLVSVGDEVAAGQPVGRLGAGGHCRSGCLHWGIRRGQVYLDPMLVIGPRRFAVLKPWLGAVAGRW